MLWGLGGKWLQNALRSPCKCATCYSTAPHHCGVQDWCGSSVLQTTPLTKEGFSLCKSKWHIILHTELHVGGTLVLCTALSLSAHAPSHSRMWGGTGSTLLHGPGWLIQAWAPISTHARGSVALPWSGPHFKLSMRGFFVNCGDFVIATQCCLLRTPQWISAIVVSFPPLPPQMQSTNPLKKRSSFDF